MLIPEHKNCRNCGTCCGEKIPITVTEKMLIEDYIKNLTEEDLRNLKITQLLAIEARKKAPGKMKKHVTRCQFRDEVRKKCLIYPVRPVICRLFGLTSFGQASSQFKCNFGNSADLPLTAPVFMELYNAETMDMPKLIDFDKIELL